MKNTLYLLGLLTLCLSFQSFQLQDPEPQEILQKILEVEKLDKILKKDEGGNYLPLMIYPNNEFSTALDLYLADEKVKLLSADQVGQLDDNSPYMEVTDFKLKAKKAKLKFLYDGVKVRITLGKIQGEWTYQSASMVGNGVYYKDLDLTIE